MKAPPTLSPVQLRQHGFTTIAVKAIPGGSLDAEPALIPTIRFEPVPDVADEWRLWLNLKLASDDPAKPFAYEVEIQIQGHIAVGNNWPADQKELIALVNGFSILYSASREMLLNITARSAHGPVSLPTLSFVALVKDARKQNAEAHPPAPAEAL